MDDSPNKDTNASATEAPAIIELPDEVDTAWWRRHGHRIQGNAFEGLRYDPSAPLREEGDTAKTEGSNEFQPDPHAFDVVMGQDELIERLEMRVLGTRALGRLFPHALFSGPAGAGKTTLATAIAQRLGSRLVRKNGPDLLDAAALIRLLASLREGDVLFVDEIHACRPAVLGILQEALAERRLSLTLQDGAVEKPVVLTLPAFTLLAATAHPAKVPQRLRTHMGILETIRCPGTEDLATYEGQAAHEDQAAAAEDFALDEDGEAEAPMGLGRPGLRAYAEHPLDFKGFAARHTCGRSQRDPGDARLGSRRAD